MQLSASFASTDISKQFSQVAKVIALNAENTTEHTSERDVFYLQLGGFDSHSNMMETLQSKFGEIDAAIDSFATEMKARGAWDDVAIFSASDFGRTLTTNGLGTDHAWGGNHFLVGGAINGSQIFGKYPSGLDNDGDLSIGRGRIIPTTSWEQVWHGLAQWFGVDDANLPTVLPNMDNFDLLTKAHLFRDVAA